VYKQCKLTSNLRFSTPTIDQLKVKAPREAAYHLLSEINICLKDYTGAIAAATAVSTNGKTV
jgi:hypothetical protein